MKSIAVLTGTRAEYGLLKPLLTLIRNSDTCELVLIVTGSHLSHEFGLTYKEIEADGFPISFKADSLLSSDSGAAISKSIALGLISCADIFSRQKFDVLVVLGDRTELLSACIAALVEGIPIAHISGGETTEGAYDEAIRHSITKMSYIHFAATDIYAKRIRQLGESADRVYVTGALGIDNIKRLTLLDRRATEESLGIQFREKNILITFHPVTLESQTAESQVAELLASLDGLEDTLLIFTKPNADKDGRVIIRMLERYVEERKDRAILFSSLGQLRYLSTLQFVDMVVGNSSSGIIEVPYFRIPTLNIGDRQKGRIMCDSIINVQETRTSITAGIEKAYSKEFRSQAETMELPYGDGNAANRIFDVLRKFSTISLKKSFVDL
ncbi:MAG: UDP-N-acetylglucosamine 2-epimerase (hydrolyzing) [Mucilaginibacter polytrichastri]|nr:UDP-N-acetylglucosamine 2-epimerase (hydrolyzing) [Mucilaginibacter polytrichastri]